MIPTPDPARAGGAAGFGNPAFAFPDELNL
jgi:hypothetical protein